MDILSDYFVKIGSQFIDPKKRVFIAYIVISIFIALGWFILSKKFSFKVLLHKDFKERENWVFLKKLIANF